MGVEHGSWVRGYLSARLKVGFPCLVDSLRVGMVACVVAPEQPGIGM